jgi:hypothetical protein
MPIVLKSGSLNLLEPWGPVKACNGIAVPLRFTPKTTCVALSVFLPHIPRVLPWYWIQPFEVGEAEDLTEP